MAAVRFSRSNALLALLARRQVKDAILAVRIRAGRFDPMERNQRQETPLHLACERELVACVEALLAVGGDPSARDWRHSTPLSRAIARAGSIEIVDMLVLRGAELNPESRAIAAPLVEAVSAKRMDIAHRLLIAGADPKRRSGAGTVLHAAIDTADPEICREVLSWNVDLEAENMLGESALSMSVILGVPEIVRLLVAAGANPHRKGGCSMTPYERAQDIGDSAVIQMMH